MKQSSLNIAGYTICFRAADDGPAIVFGKRFEKFIVADPSPSATGPGDKLPVISVTINTPSAGLPSGSKCLFQAPFVEEVHGMHIERNSEFWSIWKHDDNLFIKTSFPLSDPGRNALLRFSLHSAEWELWTDAPGNTVDPMEYPLDGLILYYLTVMSGDIMIHASGVNCRGKGYIFSGVSGKGKSTMAGLWGRSGAEIIHDDRLIVRKSGRRYMMHNTPVYDDDRPRFSWVDKIFIIEHGKENLIADVNGARAASLVMANCIQHNWGEETISELLEAVTGLANTVDVAKLAFRPGYDVVYLIRYRDE